MVEWSKLAMKMFMKFARRDYKHSLLFSFAFVRVTILSLPFLYLFIIPLFSKDARRLLVLTLENLLCSAMADW